MGSARGRCLTVAAAAAAATMTTVAGLRAVAPAAGAMDGSGGSPAKLAQGGHATFWNCPAATTEVLVAVNTLSLRPGHSLDITFAVHNGGTAACRYLAPYAPATTEHTSTTLQAGPCGSVGYEIVGPHRRTVWPGVQLVNCPALGFAELAPGAIVTGTGSWNQARANSADRVPLGSYTLFVDRRFSFPLHVVTH